MLAAAPIRSSSVLRLPFSPRARTQIGLFLLAYLVYSAARFVTIGDLASATDNAHWIVDMQNTSASASRRPCRARSTGRGCCGS